MKHIKPTSAHLRNPTMAALVSHPTAAVANAIVNAATEITIEPIEPAILKKRKLGAEDEDVSAYVQDGESLHNEHAGTTMPISHGSHLDSAANIDAANSAIAESSNLGNSPWLWVGGALALGGVAAAVSSRDSGDGKGNGGENRGDATAKVANLDWASASDADIAIAKDELLYMIEEEKMARDVYDVLYDQTGIRSFDNISDSEQTHYDSLLASAENLGIDVSGLSTSAGIFTNDKIQTLYNSLIAMGSVSNTEAIKVGVLVEQTDIVDLQAAMEVNPIVALDTVYQNLLDGSGRHLVAFNGLL